MRVLWVLLTVGLGSLAGAAPSAGCGKDAPEGFSSLAVNGGPRDFILVLPDGYDSDTPHALVFAFHGRTSPADEVRGYYDLEESAADTLGPTIFVYPVALTQADGAFGWWEPGDAPDALRDFALFDALLAELSGRYCVDSGRVYAVGHSLGGSFVNALGCHRTSALRGVVSLGAGPSGGECTGAVAAMVLHHPEDELVAFELGVAARDQYLAQNGLSGPPTPTEPRSLKCARYGAPDVPNPVVWCPHEQSYSYGRRYTHNWPEGTGEAALRFFAALP